MDRQALQVAPREAGGKGAARRLRKGGQVPAVFYGSGTEPVHLAVDGQLLDRVLHGGANAILDLQGLDEVKGKLALVKTLQRDPVSRRVLHCDLYAIDERKKVQVAVAIHLEGRPHGVEMGGLLEPILRELDVECLPLEIPDSLSLDVSALDIGDSLHVSDIQVPDGATVLNDATATVVHVVAPRVEEEPEAEVVEGELPEGAEAAPAEGAAADEAKAESGGE